MAKIKKTTKARSFAAIIAVAWAGNVNAEMNYYAELLLGSAKQYEDGGTIYTPWGSDTSKGGRLGIQFSPYFGFDAGYIEFGKATSDQAEVESSALQVGLVGALPIGEIVTLKARVGQSFSKGSYQYVHFTNEVRRDNGASGTDPFLSFGIAFDVSEMMSIVIERSMNEMKWGNYENIVENTTLGLHWRLGG